jgi:hypothetical protein
LIGIPFHLQPHWEGRAREKRKKRKEKSLHMPPWVKEFASFPNPKGKKGINEILTLGRVDA